MGGGDAAGSYAKGMSDGYVNKGEVYEVNVGEKGMAVGGWRLER